MSLARAALILTLVSACTRAAPDATPDGVVRQWLEKMEGQADDPRAAREAYALLGPASRANLEQRAERASRIMGRRIEAHEMLAEGRFGLRFRPKPLTVRAAGDRVTVEVVGADPSEHAVVPCVREAGGWRVELDLPELPPAARP